jgi:nucleoside-diphosphate-sugar epimerase
MIAIFKEVWYKIRLYHQGRDVMNFWFNKNALVTGGAGLIGSHMVEALVQKGAVVTVVDSLKRGEIRNLDAVRGKILFRQEDLTDRSVCERACQGQEVVLHLASDAYGLSYSHSHHSEIMTHNLRLNANLLDACARSGVKRLLTVSSSCVYPDDAPVPTREEVGFAGEPERGNIGYGWSKRILEVQAGFFQRDYGMEIAIVRPANVYGPRDPITGHGTHVIPSLIGKALFEEGPVVVWGSGEQARDFVYVTDAVRVMLQVTELFACGKPVNLGSMQSTTIRTLIGLILEYTGIRKEVIFDTGKPEGSRNKCLDNSMLRDLLGFQPEIGIAEGLKRTIDFYRRRGVPDGLRHSWVG